MLGEGLCINEETIVKTLVITMVMISLVATACTTIYRTDLVIASKNKPYNVKLKPKPAENILKINSPAQGNGKTGKEDGYIGFGEGEYGTITFFLQGENDGTTCEDGADWVITQIALSDEGDEATQKGSNFNSSQEIWLTQAFPGTDPDTGYIYNETKETGSTIVSITDKNDHPISWGALMAYYKIIATNCDDDSTLTADPGIGNRGK